MNNPIIKSQLPHAPADPLPSISKPNIQPPPLNLNFHPELDNLAFGNVSHTYFQQNPQSVFPNHTTADICTQTSFLHNPPAHDQPFQEPNSMLHHYHITHLRELEANRHNYYLGLLQELETHQYSATPSSLGVISPQISSEKVSLYHSKKDESFTRLSSRLLFYRNLLHLISQHKQTWIWELPIRTVPPNGQTMN